MTNYTNTTLYVGVTNNLLRRVYEHKNKLTDGFTKKYNIDKLGYFEILDDMQTAIEREKQLKAGSRKKKIELIEALLFLSMVPLHSESIEHQCVMLATGIQILDRIIDIKN